MTWTARAFGTDTLPEPYVIHVRDDGYQCRKAGPGWIITPADDHDLVLAIFANPQSAMDYWDCTHSIWEDDVNAA